MYLHTITQALIHSLNTPNIKSVTDSPILANKELERGKENNKGFPKTRPVIGYIQNVTKLTTYLQLLLWERGIQNKFMRRMMEKNKTYRERNVTENK